MNENLDKNKIPVENSDQMELDLSFEQRRALIAKQYKIGEIIINHLDEKDGKWFYDGKPIEEWYEEREKLFEEEHVGGRY